MRISLVPFVVVCAFVVAGCVPASTQPFEAAASPSVTPRSSAELLTTMLERAKSEGEASAEQLAILESGQVTWEDYEAATNAAVDCLEANGFTISARSVVHQGGVDQITYQVSYGNTSEVDPALMELDRKCVRAHSHYVSVFWMFETSDALAYRQRKEQALYPLFAQCLRERDVDVPADASFSDLHDLDDPPTEVGPDGDLHALVESCYEVIDAQSWNG